VSADIDDKVALCDTSRLKLGIQNAGLLENRAGEVARVRTDNGAAPTLDQIVILSRYPFQDLQCLVV